jgi:hypothetical protein
LGERLLCKQEVVGSIPSGSTSGFGSSRKFSFRVGIVGLFVQNIRRVISDIVKRRSLRVFARDLKSRREDAISSIGLTAALSGAGVGAGVQSALPDRRPSV